MSRVIYRICQWTGLSVIYFGAWLILGWLGIFAPLVFVIEAASKSYEEWSASVEGQGRFVLLSLVLGVLWIVAAVFVLAEIHPV